jgi:hypothetical protein
MKPAIVVFAALFAAPCTEADGLPLKNGRFPGPVVEFRLTAEQKRLIDHYRTCQLERSNTMNIYTPYVFTLSPSQAASLTRKAGFAPQRFQVYETVRGFNDAGPHWNLVLRYSENHIEIPLKLLLRDAEAREAHRMLGWKGENPCFPKLAPP